MAYAHYIHFFPFFLYWMPYFTPYFRGVAMHLIAYCNASHAKQSRANTKNKHKKRKHILWAKKHIERRSILIDLKSRQSEIIKFGVNENDCILIIEFYDFRRNFCVNTFDWERKNREFRVLKKQESSLPRKKTTRKKFNTQKNVQGEKKKTKIFVKLKRKGLWLVWCH